MNLLYLSSAASLPHSDQGQTCVIPFAGPVRPSVRRISRRCLTELFSSFDLSVREEKEQEQHI